MQVVIKPYIILQTICNVVRKENTMILTQSKTLLDAKVILKVSMTEWKSLRYVSTNIFFVQYSFVSNLFL